MDTLKRLAHFFIRSARSFSRCTYKKNVKRSSTARRFCVRVSFFFIYFTHIIERKSEVDFEFVSVSKTVLISEFSVFSWQKDGIKYGDMAWQIIQSHPKHVFLHKILYLTTMVPILYHDEIAFLVRIKTMSLDLAVKETMAVVFVSHVSTHSVEYVKFWW